jgi:hypothetical protein
MEMKKTVGFILKIVAAAMAVAALVCAVAAFWDQIMDLIDTVADKVEERRANKCFQPAEYDDYDDSIM